MNHDLYLYCFRRNNSLVKPNLARVCGLLPFEMYEIGLEKNGPGLIAAFLLSISKISSLVGVTASSLEDERCKIDEFI